MSWGSSCRLCRRAQAGGGHWVCESGVCAPPDVCECLCGESPENHPRSPELTLPCSHSPPWYWVPLTASAQACEPWLWQSHEICIVCVFLESCFPSNYLPFTPKACEPSQRLILHHLIFCFALYTFPTVSEHCWRRVSCFAQLCTSLQGSLVSGSCKEAKQRLLRWDKREKWFDFDCEFRLHSHGLARSPVPPCITVDLWALHCG